MIKNYFSLVVTEVVSRIVSFVWIAYMARYLGVSNYGQYSTVMAIISIATSFLDMGVHFIVVREVVKNPKRVSQFLGAQILIRLTLGVVMLAIFGFIMIRSDFSNEMRIFLFLAGLHMLFHNIGMIGDTMFAAFNKQYFMAIMHTAHNLGWAVLGFLFLRMEGSLFALLSAMAINSTAICVIYIWLVFSKFARPSFDFSLTFVSDLLRTAFPIGITGVLAMLFQRIDRIILSIFCGSYDVGLYSAAATLVGPISDLAWTMAIIVLYPYMAGLSHDPQRFQRVFRKILTWIFGVILGCVTVLIMFPGEIIGLGFGNKFAQSTYVLAILSLQMISLPFHGFFARVLIIEHKQREYGLANFAAFATNLALNLIFIPKWGILGASAASVVTYSLLPFYYWGFSRVSLLPFIDHYKMLQIAAVAIICATLVQIMPSKTWFLNLCIFGAVYATWVALVVNIKGEWRKTVAELK